MKQWVLYILRCSDDTLYTGITNDLNKRLLAHNSGKGAKYTRGRGPVVPVYREVCLDHIHALQREREVKKLTRQQKLALIENNENLSNRS
ncbi:MAG: GIY-YIG nuclease family protein [Oscillospiraceae bacterium]|nr:GIY-YIG nuclease family protein [Oscillospiraceae bacterium]